jgi:hypothetical protein
MKIWTTLHVFDRSWDLLTQASWRKYPNPHSPQVKTVDILDRHVDQAGVLHSERLIGVECAVPSWVTRFLGIPSFLMHVFEKCEVRLPTFQHCPVRLWLCADIECAQVDPATQTMTMRTQNVTFSSFMNVEERITYKSDETNPGSTHFVQEVQLSVPSTFGSTIGSRLEQLLMDRFRSSANRGRQAMEAACETIIVERESTPSTSVA